MRFGLVPLDERPANTRYPRMIAEIAGVELEMPPLEMLSDFRRPARCDRLSEWLQDSAPGLDGLIVSFQMLGYGGLIASRISRETSGMVLERLGVLSDLKKRSPDLLLLGFDLITRISNADSAIEEPAYWEEQGRRFYQYSQLLDRFEQGEAHASELEALRKTLPEDHLSDFTWRRARNHIVNLAGLQMLALGDLDLLVLSSDDTSPYGLPSSEKRWLKAWAERLRLGERLLMYPGADEVGCTLLARLINTASGHVPTFEVDYGVPGGENVIAAFEDGPVRMTVERQIRAVGGRLDEEHNSRSADLWLAVNPPVPRRGEWKIEFAQAERSERLPHLKAMVERLHGLEITIVADVAYPNGADPVLMELLAQEVDLCELAAYGGWNTAGNTIGTALAQGCAWLAARRSSDDLYHGDIHPVQHAAQERFLLHRYLEDWGYQHVMRSEAREWLTAHFDQVEPDEITLPFVRDFIESRLSERLGQMPGFAGRFALAPGSLHLPWKRLFEVDFEIIP